MRTPAFGVGLRGEHSREVAATPGAVDWLEIVSEEYLGIGGPRRARLERIRSQRPIAMHGVSLSVAGSGPLDAAYLASLRELAAWLEPAFVSDHLCWTALGGHQSHDLLPVAHTREVLAHVAARVARVQDALGRRILLENPTAYVAFREREMDEAELLAELCRATGCGVLLDLNNLFVNAANLGSDPARALATLPEEAVGYFHLAGHAVLPDVRIDTHDAEVPRPVWELFEAAARRFPGASVIVERDDDLPPYPALVAEAVRARERHSAAVGTGARVERRVDRAPELRTGAGSAPPEAPGWRALQAGFFERIVDRPIGFEHEGLGALLDEGLPVSARRGLRVYSDAYAASLRQALATNFPALACVIHAEDFDRLAAAYLRRHPPGGHSFAALGARLAEFLEDHVFEAGYGVPRAVLCELARLEQAELEVQDAPDPPHRLPPRALAALPPERWEGARFAFGDALRLVRASHDVAPVVSAVAAGEVPARPVERAVAYRVYRAGEGVRSEALAPLEASLLEALLAGRRFDEACAGAAAAHAADVSQVARAAAELLVHAAAHGLIAAVDA